VQRRGRSRDSAPLPDASFPHGLHLSCLLPAAWVRGGVQVVAPLVASQLGCVHKIPEGHVGVYWRGGRCLKGISDPGACPSSTPHALLCTRGCKSRKGLC